MSKHNNKGYIGMTEVILVLSLVLSLAFLASFIGGTLYLVIMDGKIGARCLELGWKDSTTVIERDGIKGFCTRLENASQITKPLEEILEE